MRAYSLNIILDLLETKGLLTNRDEAEVSMLCRLNKPDLLSFKMILIYLSAIICYLGVTGLIVSMNYINFIDLKNNNHLFALSIFISFISIILFNCSTQLQNTYYLILQEFIRLLVISTLLLAMYALYFMSIPFHLIIISTFVLFNYRYFNDSLIRFLAALILGLYIFLFIIPISFAYFSFAMFSLSVLSVCLFNIRQKSITPLLYAGLCLIIFQSFHLITTQSNLFLLENANVWTVLFQINLILIMLSHLIKLKSNIVKRISTSNLLLCLGVSLLFVWSPILTIAFITLLISYRWVSIGIMSTAIGLILYFAAYYFYNIDLAIVYKSIIMLAFGLALFLFQALIKHYQWHTEN